MKSKLIAVVLMFALYPAVCLSQQMAQTAASSAPVATATTIGNGWQQDPIESQIFPPELVMKHQRAIGLQPDQISQIKQHVQAAQAKVTDVEWDLQAEVENMVEILKGERVDEQAAVSQLMRIVSLENKTKMAHLVLAVSIKNVLTSEQQAMLRKLRRGGGRGVNIR